MNKESLLKKAYDPNTFRQKGHELVNQLADLLTHAQNRKGKVTDPKPPEELLEFWKSHSVQGSHDLFQNVIDQSTKVHHPKYIGHQVSVPVPVSALSNLLTGLLNNGMGIYEMGEGATAIEKIVVDIFCDHIGYKGGGGVFTSGGTLANLTGLLAARASYKEKKIWTEGTSDQYCIMVSEMAHYCVDRAVRIMGWGENGIIKVPVNDKFKMDTLALSSLYDKATKDGKKVLAIVGSAPCTATGSYDDLHAIADFCKDQKLWFHVDGAHGGPAIFSKKYNYLMSGAERADSVVIDAHKMMLTPALTTALLFKRKDDSYHTFSQDAYYLWEGQEDREWYNLARRTFECTKVMMAVRVFTIIKEYGIEIFDEYVTRQYNLAREFAEVLDQSDDFELAIFPDSNIVCFRYIPDYQSNNQEDISELNRKIRKDIFQKGDFYLVQTQLNDDLYLRVSLMNSLTTINDLKEVLDAIRNQGKDHLT